MFLVLCVVGGLVYASKNGWLSAAEKAINEQVAKIKSHSQS